MTVQNICIIILGIIAIASVLHSKNLNEQIKNKINKNELFNKTHESLDIDQINKNEILNQINDKKIWSNFFLFLIVLELGIIIYLLYPTYQMQNELISTLKNFLR